MSGTNPTSWTTWLRRIGEGLVIGIGAAIVLAVYAAMSSATSELQTTRLKLEKQADLNQRLKDQASLTAIQISKLDRLIDQAEQSAKNIESLAERVKSLESTAEATSGSEWDPGAMDWEKFKVPGGKDAAHSSGSSSLTPSWLSVEQQEKLGNIQKLIDEQRQLRY